MTLGHKLVFCVVLSLSCFSTQITFGQKNKPSLPSYSRSLLLETKIDTTANVSMGDFNGDGHLDILLVKGRHWPIVDRILLGDGKGGLKRSYNLGLSDRSYTGGLADFNGDGFTDIAVSNDTDAKVIYLNDGKGSFTIGSEFGRPEWPTRNIAIADLNGDGLPDIILANRGDSKNTSNYISLNRGNGHFDTNYIPIAPYPTTTIYPIDLNHDGFVDLIIPNRDGGQSYVYLGNSDHTFSETHRIPFGPSDVNVRVAAAADFNGDSFPDIVTTDELKGVYIYYGKKDNTYSPGTLLADAKIVPYSLTIADLDNDNKPEIIIGHMKAPSSILSYNASSNSFDSISFGDSQGDVYGFAIGDFDEDGVLDIAAARNEAQNIIYFGDKNSKRQKSR